MRLLVCAATDGEAAAWGEPAPDERVRVVGVGVPEVFFRLTPPDPLPDAVVAIGIAGAYAGTGLEIGDLVLADSEVYGDIGFELPEPPGFRAVSDVPFGAFYADPIPLRVPDALRDGARVGRGCTVGTCTGTDALGALRRDRFDALFETMEGAAVAQIARGWGVPVCQVRAVSNVAARRDMRPENIRRALEALSDHLTRCRPRLRESDPARW